MTDINVGAIVEILNDKTDRDLHNVNTGGGADAVVEYQNPTAENNYTWYRKYASGWVEQGGFISMYANNTIINLFKQMRDTNYLAFCSVGGTDYRESIPSVHSKTTTTFKITHNAGLNNEFGIYWEVKGYIQE